MKLFRTIAFLFALIMLIGCKDITEEQMETTLDYSDPCLVEIGGVSIDNGQPQSKSVSPLAEGENLRIYVFPHGTTDFSKLVTTYSYTIIDGKPVLDAGQGADGLYLPYGELDIYTVSPASVVIGEDASANPIYGIVASKTGVRVPEGTDLLASKSTKTIIRGAGAANNITLAALNHKMAQVRVRLKRNAGATYRDIVMTKVCLTGQTTEPQTFHLGDGGGSFTASDAGTQTVKIHNITTILKNKEYIATAIVFPRKATRMKIEVEFDATSVKNPGTADETIITEPYLMSGYINDMALEGGKLNALYCEPLVSVDILWRTELLPWNNQPTTEIERDLVFHYDGNDAPEIIDGKLCWRDRSGNGNHGILNDKVVYNATGKYYDLSNSGQFSIPDLGMIENYTFEIVAKVGTYSSGAGFPIIFSSVGGNMDVRDFSFHINFMNKYFSMDNGGASGENHVSTLFSDKTPFSTMRTYYFQNINGKTMALGINGDVTANEAKSGRHNAFTYNKVGFGNPIEYKISSMRLYRRFLSQPELKANYESDKVNFDSGVGVVTNGLILNLDGRTPPRTDVTGTYWDDSSPSKNNAKYLHRSGSNQISHTGLGYKIDNKQTHETSMMKLINSLGVMPEMTIEITAKTTKTLTTVMFSGSGDNDWGTSLRINWPGGNRDIVFDCPITGGRCIYNGPYADLSYLSEFRSLIFTRNNNNYQRIMLGDQTVIKDFTANPAAEMNHTYIGNMTINTSANHFFNGEIRSIRIYNRVLSPEELTHNNKIDQLRLNEQ